MKKFSKKGLLLFAGAMAVCAFAMPAMASASSWGVLNSHHVLTSSNLGFVGDATGTSSMCTGSSFTARVTSAANLEITASTFSGCVLAAPGAGATACTATSTGINFPWTATARTTSDIQIHGLDISIPLDNQSGTSCGALAGNTLRITGTLTGGRWRGNGTGSQVESFGGAGLVSHAPAGLGGTVGITPTGTIGDASLTVS